MKEQEVVEVVDDFPNSIDIVKAAQTDENCMIATNSTSEKPESFAKFVTEETDHQRPGPGNIVAYRVADEQLLNEADNSLVVKSTSKIWSPLERFKRVLDRICSDPYALSFLDPVDTNLYDDYLDVIETPICLNDVKNKLRTNQYKGQYQFGKFIQDLRLIWRNCKIYNLYQSQIWQCAHVLSLLSDRLYQSWVMSFQDGSISMDEPLGCPWESSCRYCLKEDSEDSMMLCDHCDASFHTFCLEPPLETIPEGIWICTRCTDWLSKTGSKILSASVEDEARQVTKFYLFNKIIDSDYFQKLGNRTNWPTASYPCLKA